MRWVYTVIMADLTFESKDLAPDRLWLRAAGPLSSENTGQLQAWLVDMAGLIEKMHAVSGVTISCVFDLVGMGQAQGQDIISSLVEFQKQNKPHIRRTALIIKDPDVRLTMSVVAALADRYNIRSFASNQEAEGWAFGQAE